MIVKFTPCDIYTFNESTTARINMKDAVREAYDPVTGEISFSYTFTVPADKTIYEVDVMGVTPPVAGEAPSFDFEIPEGVAYKKYVDSRDDTCWWNEYTPGGDRLNTFTKSNYMGLSEEQMKFKPGYTYEFSTVLSYTDDNRFSENVSATMNYEPVAVGEETTTMFCYITQTYTCYTDAPRIVASKTVASRGEMVDFTVYLPPVKNLRSLNLNMMFAESGLTVYPYSLKLNEGIKDKVDAGNFGIDMYGNLNLAFTEEYSKDGETKLLTFTCLVDENARGKVMFPFAAVLYAKEPYMDVYPIFADTDLMSEEITVSASVGGYTVGGGFVCGGGEYLTSFELIPQGTSAPAYATHEVGTLSGTSYGGTWSISNVSDGIYTLRVSKKDHRPREYTVTVSGSEVKQNVELYLQGDVNGDGTVNTVDVILTLRHIAGWSISIDQSSADYNGDGKIVTTDVILMLRKIAGWNV